MILNADEFPSLHGLLSCDDLDAMLSGRVERGSSFEVREFLARRSFEAHAVTDTVEMSAQVWAQEGRPTTVEIDCIKTRGGDFVVQGVCIQVSNPARIIAATLASLAETECVNTPARTLRPLFSERYRDRISLGDTTCANNARSPHLRCAINPCGPCEGCESYE